jgi:hypothetical protein
MSFNNHHMNSDRPVRLITWEEKLLIFTYHISLSIAMISRQVNCLTSGTIWTIGLKLHLWGGDGVKPTSLLSKAWIRMWFFSLCSKVIFNLSYIAQALSVPTPKQTIDIGNYKYKLTNLSALSLECSNDTVMPVQVVGGILENWGTADSEWNCRFPRIISHSVLLCFQAKLIAWHWELYEQ